jgi:hypothetical protein
MASIDANIQAFTEASAKVKNRGSYLEVRRRSQTCLGLDQNNFTHSICFETSHVICLQVSER